MASDALARYSLRVGDVTVAVAAASADVSFRVDEPACRFLVRDASPGRHDARTARGGGEACVDLSVSVARRPLASGIDGRLVFDSHGTWTLYESAGRLVYRLFDPRLGPAPYREARLSPDLASADLLLNPDFHEPGEPVDPLQYPLDELLFLHLLAGRDGVELHACGVVAPSGAGYVFAGQSGDGKTTMARLWESVPGAVVLSDDRIVIRRSGPGYVMYGTPWHGEAELAAAASAPVRAVSLLARGERNVLEALTPAESTASLLARSIIPRQASDAGAMQATLSLLEGLARHVPVRRLRFVPDSAAPRFVLAEEAAGDA